MADANQIYTYSASQSQLKHAFKDFGQGFGYWRLWTALAWEDLRQRYRRSFLGLLWTPLSFAFFLFVKNLIFGPMSNVDFNYFLVYLAFSFFAWDFMSGMLVDACAVFLIAENWIKGRRLPLTLFVLQTMTRQVILATTQFGVVVAIMIWLQWELTLGALWAIPIFLLYCINAFALCFILGALTARYRDVLHFVQAVMRVMFFLSPVLWLPEQIGAVWKYLQYNPFAQFLIAFRSPILEGQLNMPATYTVLGFTGVFLILAIVALTFSRRRLIFWL